MTDEDIVAALAEALPFTVWQAFHGPCESPTRSEREKAARALLPVVRRVAEQRAAEELLAAADAYWRDVTFPIARYPEVRDWLHARAAALTATPNHGTDPT